MARSYRHISDYAEEIMQLKASGKTKREIGELLGFSKEQIHGFITRYNAKQRKLAAGIKLNPKGRPRKDKFEVPASNQQLSKLTQLRYELANKDRKIKRLEMENELMRDFLSRTERK